MIAPPPVKAKNKTPAVSIWHRSVGDLLGRGGAKVPAGELAVFCRKMGFLVGAGVDLREVFPLVIGQTKGRLLRQVLPDVHM